MTVNVDNQTNVTTKKRCLMMPTLQYTEDFQSWRCFLQDRKDNTLQLNSN